MKHVKQFIYFSIGFASHSNEKLLSTVQKLIEQGKISKKDAKAFLKDYFDVINKKTDDFYKNLEAFIRNSLEDKNFIKKEELDKISKRIDKLENKISK